MMIQPMQYELERAYHTRCEATATRQREIREAERQLAGHAWVGHSVLSIALQLQSRLMPARRSDSVVSGLDIGAVEARPDLASRPLGDSDWRNPTARTYPRSNRLTPTPD